MLHIDFLNQKIFLYEITTTLCAPKIPFLWDVFIVLQFVYPVTVLYNTANLFVNQSTVNMIQIFTNLLVSAFTYLLSNVIKSERPFMQCADSAYYSTYAFPATDYIDQNELQYHHRINQHRWYVCY